MDKNAEIGPFIEKMANIFKVMGDPTRLHLLGQIAKYNHNNQSLCVHDLAKQLEVSESAISQHLRVLKGLGILVATRQGIHKYYSVKFDAMKSLVDDVNKLVNLALIPCDQCIDINKGSSDINDDSKNQKLAK